MPEDRLLATAYTNFYSQGAWMVPASAFQHALTSREIKFAGKRDNISGLQWICRLSEK
jgi:hypothetical protein